MHGVPLFRDGHSRACRIVVNSSLRPNRDDRKHMPPGMPPELQLILRVQLFVLLSAAILICVSTFILYVRTRTKPALVMLMAVVIGLSGQAMGYFSPNETVVYEPDREPVEPRSFPSFSDSPPGYGRITSARDSWETPAFWLVMSGVVLWVGGFVAHSFSVARKKR